MAHTYHTLQHWHLWLSQQSLGQSLIDIEVKHIINRIGKHLGKHTALIGVPSQQPYLKACTIPCQLLITPLHHNEKQADFIEGNFQELPLLTGSTDLVILPHTLEFIDNPRQLITEACRIIKPDGLLLIIGFNPYSLWGLEKLLHKKNEMPWRARAIMPQQLKNWLQLHDFSIENFGSLVHRPFIRNHKWFERLAFLDHIGHFCTPTYGSIYTILAKARVVPLTPIKFKWHQSLYKLRISRSFSGYIAR